MKKPTVSELIRLLDKPGLLKWANKIGLEGTNINDYRAKSKSKGTSYHNEIENHIKKGTPFSDELVENAFNSFSKDVKIIHSERDIETDYFVGRYDIQLERDGQIYICDFKSSEGIYLENKLQLAAYGYKQHHIYLAVVKIPEFIFKPVSFDRSSAEQILESLYKIYTLKNLL